MKEDLLHYIWRTKRFDAADLKTTQGEQVNIISFGQHNNHAGPDFLNARIRIGSTEWAGNVEMHSQASDWIKHQHGTDNAYNNVILHVVFEEDVPVLRPTGERIPCVELKCRIAKILYSQYARLQFNERRIACEGQQQNVPGMIWNAWLERLLIERLQRKTSPIEREMGLCKNDREEVFYRLLARHFGVNVNADPFERLARSLPLIIIDKHRHDPLAVEALLFGQAGLLQGDFKDEYPQRLQREYEFLKGKYGLQPIHRSEWKLLRLRPANFPTIRIAQFAALMGKTPRLFSRILWAGHFKEIHYILQTEVSEYWQSHYVFDKPSGTKAKKLGLSTMRLITINAIVPMLFHYGRSKQEEVFVDKALALLHDLPPEKNRIISDWDALGIPAADAARSQALIQLRKEYCHKKKCLQCMVGNKLLI
jgi:hypothetical protein